MASAPSTSFFDTSTPNNFLSKPLAVFQHNNCRNNGQRSERNESCHNDDHQSAIDNSLGLNQPHPVLRSTMLPMALA